MHSIIRTRQLLFGIFMLQVARPLAAQQPGVRTIVLDKGAKELDEPFTSLNELVELRNGRLIALDDGDEELRLVDLATGKVTPIGRKGSGPLEYRMPGKLLTGAADSVTYYDAIQRRLLLLTPAGVPARTIPLFGAGDVSAILSGAQPGMVDAAGRVYGQTLGMAMKQAGGNAPPSGVSFADSVDIQVMDLRGGKPVTLLKVRSVAAQLSPKIAMGPSGVSYTITAPNYSSTDAWTVLPDGRIAALLGGKYQVHFFTAGRPEVLGPVIPATVVPVTAAERANLMDSLRIQLDSQMAKAKSQLAGNPATKDFKMEAKVVEPASWAAVKPAYTGLQSSPDGLLWVGLPRPMSEKRALYEVLNSKGALVTRVQLAAGERLVGLGRGTVYTTRTDEDGLQYLRKYVLPKLQ